MESDSLFIPASLGSKQCGCGAGLGRPNILQLSCRDEWKGVCVSVVQCNVVQCACVRVCVHVCVCAPKKLHVTVNGFNSYSCLLFEKFNSLNACVQLCSFFGDVSMNALIITVIYSQLVFIDSVEVILAVQYSCTCIKIMPIASICGTTCG